MNRRHAWWQVTIPGEDTPRERSFAIRIKWAATVDIKAIVDFVRCANTLGCWHYTLSRQLEWSGVETASLNASASS